MGGPSRSSDREAPSLSERRRYDSPVRRQQTAQTRDRILEAGSALVHGFPSWDWRSLTYRAVAAQAGVSERTVYRHFATEQELHRAVMRRLEEEAGISYEGLRLEDLVQVTARILESTRSFAAAPPRMGPPFDEEDRRRRDALLAAVSTVSSGWPQRERVMAAAVLDVIWAIPSYERLVTSWALSSPDATQAVTGLMRLVVQAVQEGQRPWAERPGPSKERLSGERPGNRSPAPRPTRSGR
jgi:AcrR family transcriptional regulator